MDGELLKILNRILKGPDTVSLWKQDNKYVKHFVVLTTTFLRIAHNSKHALSSKTLLLHFVDKPNLHHIIRPLLS